jgi:tetratricopeptide (TPR) repeat protein
VEETIQKWLAADQTGLAALKVGRLFAQHADYEAATQYFRQAVNDEASRYAAQIGLADAEFRLDRPESALQTLQGLRPLAGDADYHLLRAAILDKLQRFQDALAAYQQAIRAQPKQETPYFDLGLFFVRHQAFDAAQENFRASQRVLPQSLRLALAEAIVLNLAGKRAESHEKLQEIENNWPEQDLPYIVAGISAYTAYRFEEAQREFEKAESLESANPLTYYYLALINSTSNPADRMETLHWAEMAVAGDPTFAQAQALLGRLYKELGRNEEARKCLEEAVRLQPDLSDAHYLLSRVYSDLGDAARAAAEIRESQRWHREISQVSPENENVLRLLVKVDSTPR